jgi:hypothetical protein
MADKDSSTQRSLFDLTPTILRCRRCQEEKPIDAFDVYTGNKGRQYRRKDCRACQPKIMADWRRANPERNRRKVRLDNLRRRLGGWFNLEIYESMLAAQGGVCDICGKPEKRTYRGKVLPLHVDHDHETGKVRALLCCNCNSMIGFSGDDPAMLLAAVEYLRRHADEGPVDGIAG